MISVKFILLGFANLLGVILAAIGIIRILGGIFKKNGKKVINGIILFISGIILFFLALLFSGFLPIYSALFF